MKPGSKVSSTRDGENAGGADDFEGWGKFVEVCGAKQGLAKKVPEQQPFPNRPVIIIAVIVIITLAITIGIIIIIIIITISSSSLSSSSSTC